MGADMVAVGYTIKSGHLVELDAARRIFEGVLEAVIEKRKQIDIADRWEFFTTADPDTPEYEEELRSEVLNHILSGIGWMVENHREQAVYHTDSTGRYAFIVSGGMTWGDDPFDEFEDVQLVLCAVEEIPSLGPLLGILGGGIRSTFVNGTT